MDLRELDEQLSSMAKPLPQAAQLEARRVADESVPRRFKKGRVLRPRWVFPAAFSAGVVLTAGAGTAAVMLSHWGGVSMPEENVRTTEPIPVTWVTETGHEENCRAWIELRNPAREDATMLDSAIEARDWSGLGQRLYDAASIPSDDPEGELRVTAGLTPVLQDFAGDTFPGITWLGEGQETPERAVDAWGMTCAPDTEQP